MMPWRWRFWRLAGGGSDGTLLVDASGEWFRLFGGVWWLGERKR
jgi:hypothetical protein